METFDFTRAKVRGARSTRIKQGLAVLASVGIPTLLECLVRRECGLAAGMLGVAAFMAFNRS